MICKFIGQHVHDGFFIGERDDQDICLRWFGKKARRDFHFSCQGSVAETPAASNGAVSRIATIIPLAAAVAAINPLAALMAKPA